MRAVVVEFFPQVRCVLGFDGRGLEGRWVRVVGFDGSDAPKFRGPKGEAC